MNSIFGKRFTGASQRLICRQRRLQAGCSRWLVLAALPLVLACPEAFAADPVAARPEVRAVTDRQGVLQAFEAIRLSEALAKTLPARTLDDDFRRTFAVYVVDNTTETPPPPIVGTYIAGDAALRFSPQFPFSPGTRYRAVLSLDADAVAAFTAARRENDSSRIVLEVAVPEAARRPPTELTQVYPSAEMLPENLLRLYFHFSAPMSRGDTYRHMRLRDENGRPVVAPFLEIGEELWDPRGTRLTLLLDPGRIKSGLKPREEDGPVLVAGRKYTLVVDPAWQDAWGQPLKKGFEKTFVAGSSESQAIDPAQWKIAAPAPGTSQPLTIAFPRPLDRALLQHAFSLRGPDGKFIAGEVRVADAERRWEFTPKGDWQPGPYRLVVDMQLEDVCGNRIGRPFEVDRWQPFDEKPGPATHEMSIAIGGQPAAQ